MSRTVEKFCADNSLPYNAVMAAIGLYVAENIEPMMRDFIGSNLEPILQNSKDEILQAIASSKTGKGPGRPASAGSGGKNKNPDYAPNRESIICEITGVKQTEDGKFSIMFSSVNERPYGKFSHFGNFSAEGIIEMFCQKKVRGYESQDYITAIGPEEQEALSYYRANPDLSPNVLNPVCVSENLNNANSYTYLIEVKRKLASIHDPVFIESITPYGMRQ